MNGKQWFAVFAWRGDARYHLQDALGSRVYWSRKAADQRAEVAMREIPLHVAPNGYVSRSSEYVLANGCNIGAKGRITLADGTV